MHRFTHRALAAAAVLLLPAAAVAQAVGSSALREVDDDRTDLVYQGLTVDQLEDLDVVRDGEVIGEIEEVLANDQDEIVAVVVEYGGGFLDLGEREVVMPVEQLQFDGDARQAATTMGDDDLKALQVWDD